MLLIFSSQPAEKYQHLTNSVNQHHWSCSDVRQGRWVLISQYVTQNGQERNRSILRPYSHIQEVSSDSCQKENTAELKTKAVWWGCRLWKRIESGRRDQKRLQEAGQSQAVKCVWEGALALPPSCATLGNILSLSLLTRNTGWASLFFKLQIWKLFGFWHDATVENSTPDFVCWIIIRTVTQNNIPLNSPQTICFNLLWFGSELSAQSSHSETWAPRQFS